jgi:hypothetical protein
MNTDTNRNSNVTEIVSYAVLGVSIAVVAAVFLAKPVASLVGAMIDGVRANMAGILTFAAIMAFVGFFVWAIRTSNAASRQRRSIMTHVCCDCGMEVRPFSKTVGRNEGRSVWFLLGIVGLLFFLVPGLICFAIGASLSAGRQVRFCGHCSSERMVPLSSPKAKSMTGQRQAALVP